MGNSSSPMGTTQRYIPGIAATERWKFAGVDHFETQGELDAAVTLERLNIDDGTPVWRANQRFTVGSNRGYHVWTVGATSAQCHADTVINGYTPKLQFMTTRTQGVGQGALSVNTANREDTRFRFYSGPAIWQGVKLLYPTFYLAPAYTLAPNAFTVEASIERLSGATMAAWSAAATKTLAPSDLLALSDAFAAVIGAGELLYVRTGATMTAGQQIPTGYLRIPNTNAIDAAATSSAGSSQINAYGPLSVTTPYAANLYGYGPIGILGIPDRYVPAVLILGDSIDDAAGYDATGDGFSNIGFTARGLAAANVPFCKSTRGTGKAVDIIPATAPGVHLLMQYATHVLVGSGTNDLAAGTALATIQANLLLIYASARSHGCKVYQRLILPRTTSTDAWATLGNQTTVSRYGIGEDRDTINAWFQSLVLAGTIDGVINPLPYFESDTAHGKWVAGGTADGTHPTETLHGTAAACMTAFGNAIIRAF